MKHAGVVGLGNMGLGMAKNLLAAGFAITGYDLRPERTRLLAGSGGRVAESLPGLADADAVFVMVMTGAQALSVTTALRGILRPGAAIIVTATIAPSEMEAIAAALAGSGLRLIDCPVSGGKAGADAGSLTLMAAAEEAVLEQNRALLEAVGGQIFHVGEAPGTGQTVKAALQAFIGVTYAGIFESLALGAAAGVKGETLYHVFRSTHLGNTPFFESCARLILERKFQNGGSHISTMVKDLGISLGLARETGLPLFATSAASALFQAGASLYPDGDNWAIVQLLEACTGKKAQW